jgi:hypothetical protein
MGFKLPGKSIQSGTSAHSSALKMKAKENTASALKHWNHPDPDADHSVMDHAKENVIDPIVKKGKEIYKKTKEYLTGEGEDKKAYGGDRTWAEGQKGSGNTLNQTTRNQKAYEKEMKAKDSKWNKREDNEWKKRQNKINQSLGSKKVYDTVKDSKSKVVKRDGEDVEVVKGIGAKNKKTLTTKEKSAETAKISIQKDIIKKSKDDKRSATTKEDKSTAKTTRDEAQGEIGEIRSGRDDAKTGTVVSRWFGKQKAKRNKRQLEKRAKKNEEV